MVPAVRSTLDVALWMLLRAESASEHLQPQKLQRLLYLAQAHYAGEHEGAKLLPATFLATDIGPVEPNIFQLFELGTPQVPMGDPKPRIEEFLMGVWDKYGGRSTEELLEAIASDGAYSLAIKQGSNSEITMEMLTAGYGGGAAQAVRGAPNRTATGSIGPSRASVRPNGSRARPGNPKASPTAAARATLDGAAVAYRAAGLASGEAAASLEAGTLSAAAGDPDAAQVLLGAPADLYRVAGDAVGEARALLARAAVFAAEGQHEAARTAYQGSAARFQQAGLPFGQLLAALGLGDLERSAGNGDGAATAYRAAEGLMRAMEQPVAEANRMLGLPPVASLSAVPIAELPPDEVPDPALAAVDDEGPAQFPAHNAEGRAQVAAALARLAAAEL